ncbi:MAG: hypothetical protein ACXWAC_01320 [Usitatibacter sp.]
MFKRNLFLAALAISSLGVLPLPASADVGIYLDISPPPPRHEIMPAARPGFVWQPGYWDWRDGRHHWVKGYWVKERRGMYWHPSRWEQRDGKWVLERGRWDRQRWVDNRNGPAGDRDRDGVPNRFDRDRDGDGVPNRLDRAPDNPRRQ